MIIPLDYWEYAQFCEVARQYHSNEEKVNFHKACSEYCLSRGIDITSASFELWLTIDFDSKQEFYALTTEPGERPE